MKMPDNEKLISEIRNRIQFIVTIEIFFLSFLLLYFEFVGSEEMISSGNALFFGIEVAFLILSYIWVGVIERSNQKFLVFPKFLVDLNLFLFSVVFIVIALVSHQALADYWEWIFKISLWGVLFLPIVTFLTIIGTQYWQSFRLFLKWLSGKKLSKNNPH